MAQAWGNMAFGIRELDQRNGESTVQAFAWDVETNTRREVTFQVPHIRYTRSGSKRLEDPRDIYEMVANQGARRLRACILAVIPGDVTEAAVAQCEVTMKAKADTSPEGIAKIVSAFEQFGVTKDQIEKRIQRRIEAIQPAQVVSLKKIYASLRDGMSQPSEWFEQPEQPAAADHAGSKTENVKDQLRKRKETQQQKPETHATQTRDDGDGDMFEDAPAADDEGAAYTYAQVADMLEKSTDMDTLAIAGDFIQYVGNVQHREELGAIYKRKLNEFKTQQ